MERGRWREGDGESDRGEGCQSRECLQRRAPITRSIERNDGERTMEAREREALWKVGIHAWIRVVFHGEVRAQKSGHFGQCWKGVEMVSRKARKKEEKRRPFSGVFRPFLGRFPRRSSLLNGRSRSIHTRFCPNIIFVQPNAKSRRSEKRAWRRNDPCLRR